ncbi:MAG: Rap1a/Tai family immunity protein [Gammaproteobacteria bacterium]
MQFIAALVLAAYALVGWSQPLDGHALRERCETAASTVDSGFCAGYLTAVADTLRSVNRYYKQRRVFNVCPPQPEAQDSAWLVRHFLDWADRHGDKLHHSANETAIAALHDAFRCRHQ